MSEQLHISVRCDKQVHDIIHKKQCGPENVSVGCRSNECRRFISLNQLTLTYWRICLRWAAQGGIYSGAHMIERALLKYICWVDVSEPERRWYCKLFYSKSIICYNREVDSTSEIHGEVPSWWMGCSTKLHPHFPRPRNRHTPTHADTQRLHLT